jgi:hypothetical protein
LRSKSLGERPISFEGAAEAQKLLEVDMRRRQLGRLVLSDAATESRTPAVAAGLTCGYTGFRAGG